jgi:hypothetical protein
MKALIMLVAKTESPNRHHNNPAMSNPTDTTTPANRQLTPEQGSDPPEL